jgi:hypothetical protein
MEAAFPPKHWYPPAVLQSCHNLEDYNVNAHSCENIKTYTT